MTIFFLVWYVIGFIAVAWSYYWKIKDDFWVIAFVALAGPIVIPEAINMREKYKDLR